MINHVPQELQYLPQAAMQVWFEGKSIDFPEKDLEKLRLFLIEEIKGSDAIW